MKYLEPHGRDSQRRMCRVLQHNQQEGKTAP